MTKPDQASTADRAPAAGRSTRYDRIGRYIATKGWAHLLLLFMVAVFLLPFIWMVGLSLKTDEEVTDNNFFPKIPVFRADSPLVRTAPVFDRPIDTTASQWDQVLPVLHDTAVTALAGVALPPGAGNVNSNDLRDTAATRLISEAVEKLPEETWTAPSGKMLASFKSTLTPDALAEALDTQLGRLTFRGLQFRTLDAKITTVFPAEQATQQWRVVSGNASWVPGKGEGILKYHFDSSSDTPITLQTEFDFAPNADQLHKIMIGMGCDDSWHRIDATLRIGNQKWYSKQTTYIAQYRPTSLVLEPPCFDDSTYQPKTWINLLPVALSREAGSLDSHKAQLTLTITPTGTVGAVYGKVQRNYLRAFRSVPFWTYLINSTLLVALQTMGALFSSGFVAYAFARLNWPGRTLAFGLLLSTMMLPTQVTMIPSFLIWKSLGWYNTLNPLWISSWFGSAFFIFLMTQNMKTIPRELEEAARIDGLNSLQTWWYIIMPLVKPTLAAIAIMTFMGAWNDFMSPLIMLRDQSRFPLSLGLFGMKLDQTTDFTLIMAGNMLMTLPVIAIFFLFQRYFIEGVTVSGMKG